MNFVLKRMWKKGGSVYFKIPDSLWEGTVANKSWLWLSDLLAEIPKWDPLYAMGQY